MKHSLISPFDALELAYGVGVVNSCAKEKILLEGLKQQSEDTSKVSYIGFLNIPKSWKIHCERYSENVFYHKYHFEGFNNNIVIVQIDKEDNKIYLLFDDDCSCINSIFSDIIYPLLRIEMNNHNLTYFCNINSSQFLIK